MRKFKPTGKSGTESRRANQFARINAARAAARAHNNRVMNSGVSSVSVFQQVSRRPEKKFLDVTSSLNLTAGVTTGVLSGVLNGCAQGTDAIQHIGRQTTMTSLYWMWEGQVTATTVGGSPVRLVIFYDKEAEGTAPTIAAGAQSDAFSVDSIIAQMNLNNRDRFVVLVDEIVECLGQAGPQSFMRKGYRKIRMPVVFNSNTGSTIAAINTGSVYAVIWQSGSLTTAGATTQLQTRIRFEDN